MRTENLIFRISNYVHVHIFRKSAVSYNYFALLNFSVSVMCKHTNLCFVCECERVGFDV